MQSKKKKRVPLLCGLLDKWSKCHYSYYYNIAADELAHKQNAECIAALFSPMSSTSTPTLDISVSALKGFFLLNHRSWGRGGG